MFDYLIKLSPDNLLMTPDGTINLPYLIGYVSSLRVLLSSFVYLRLTSYVDPIIQFISQGHKIM